MTTKSGRKKSGGRYIASRKKKLYERIGQERKVSLNKTSSDEKRKTQRITGGNIKVSLLKAKFINVRGKDKKIKKVEIKNVLETPANRFLARQNLITKSAVVDTEIGKVRVTSRPSQDGVLNGILIE